MNGHSNEAINGVQTNGHHYERHLHPLRVPPDLQHATDSSSAGTSPTTPTSTTSSRRSPTRVRKPSNPLAPPFIVSAPGKTIVYGEHAVVHGKAAIAAAISLRTYLMVTTLTKSQRTVSLKFVDIGLDHTWNIPDLPWAEFAHPSRKKKYYDLVTTLDSDLVAAMKPHIEAVSPGAAPERRKIHMAAASAFLYLFLSLGSERSNGCIYAMRSTVPVGVGLGSSASVCVCISAALLVQARALSGPHPDQMATEAEEQLERINRWAFVGEMGIHGNPSGVDNTVATHGHAVLFQRPDYAQPPVVTILRAFPELPLLLVDTGIPKSTSAQVAKVAARKVAEPKLTNHLLDAIDCITRAVYALISADDFDPAAPDAAHIARLGELMSTNHALLSGLGVSHPRLDYLRYLVDQAGLGWTKLTGAGGGGCAITLLNPDIFSGSRAATTPSLSDDKQQQHGPHTGINGAASHSSSQSQPSPPPTTAAEAFHALEQRLAREGFAQYATTLGGDGVGILSPAVIAGDEIDLEMFLTAEGREGVEDLVGAGREARAEHAEQEDCGESAGSGEGVESAWKYWRP